MLNKELYLDQNPVIRQLWDSKYSHKSLNVDKRAETKGKVILDILGFIDGFTLKDVLEAVKQNPKEIVLYINSPGGSAYDGIAAYNALKGSKAKISAHNLGLAASAASIIFLAGDTRRMEATSELLFHNVRTFVFGTADQIIKEAKQMQKTDERLVKNVYGDIMDLDEESIKSLLKEDRTMDKDEALSLNVLTDSKTLDACANVANGSIPLNWGGSYRSETTPANEPGPDNETFGEDETYPEKKIPIAEEDEEVNEKSLDSDKEKEDDEEVKAESDEEKEAEEDDEEVKAESDEDEDKEAEEDEEKKMKKSSQFIDLTDWEISEAFKKLEQKEVRL